jgi:autotransporter adhesin
MTARASIVRRCDRNAALAGIELKWPAVSTVRLKRILDASRTQNSANWNRGHFCNLRSWTIMKFSQKVPAALATLAVALCLGTAPVKAQFVCAGNTPATTGGDGANATGSISNFACGTAANAAGSGSSNTAIGDRSDASGDNSHNTANGFLANASGAGSHNTAFGFGAIASGNGTNNTAFGTDAHATGANSSALGNGAQATFANSTAIGNGAAATRDNQQMFGTASNTYTMAGIATAASRAAQVGPTSIVTSDTAGNLAARSFADLGLASQSDISGINGRLDALNGRINDVNREARGGIALALAASGLQFDTRPGKVSLSGGYGNFKGESGFAVGLGYAVSESMRFNAAFTAVRQGDIGARVGASWTLN